MDFILVLGTNLRGIEFNWIEEKKRLSKEVKFQRILIIFKKIFDQVKILLMINIKDLSSRRKKHFMKLMKLFNL